MQIKESTELYLKKLNKKSKLIIIIHKSILQHFTDDFKKKGFINIKDITEKRFNAYLDKYLYPLAGDEILEMLCSYMGFVDKLRKK